MDVSNGLTHSRAMTSYLTRHPSFGSVGTLAPVSTRFIHVECGRPLDGTQVNRCTCTEYAESAHAGTVIGMLRRRGDIDVVELEDLLDRAQEAAISPERAVDLYSEPVWADA